MILVIAEQRDGKLNRATWETIAAAQQLSGDMPINVAVLGASTEAAAQEVASAAIAEVLVAEHAALEPYTPDAYASASRSLIESASPTFVLLPHTYQTRDFAPLLAARLRKPLIPDVTAISGTGADAAFLRPMFQGKLAAQVKPQGGPPAIVTTQIGAFRADAATERCRNSAPRVKGCCVNRSCATASITTKCCGRSSAPTGASGWAAGQPVITDA